MHCNLSLSQRRINSTKNSCSLLLKVYINPFIDWRVKHDKGFRISYKPTHSHLRSLPNSLQCACRNNGVARRLKYNFNHWEREREKDTEHNRRPIESLDERTEARARVSVARSTDRKSTDRKWGDLIGRPVARIPPSIGHVGGGWSMTHPRGAAIPRVFRLAVTLPQLSPPNPLVVLPSSCCRWSCLRENEHYHNPWRQRQKERCTIGTRVQTQVSERHCSWRVSFARYESRGFVPFGGSGSSWTIGGRS